MNPTLIKTAYIKQALDLYNEALAPEKQHSIPPLSKYLENWSHLAYSDKRGEHLEGGFVTDIGKYWRKTEGLTKSIHENQSSWSTQKIAYIDILKSVLFYKTIKLRQIINRLH